jgi:RecA/RadA recombinase
MDSTCVQYEDDMNCNIKVPKIKSKPVSKVRLPRIFRADRDLLDLAESLVKEVAAEHPDRYLSETEGVIAVLIVFVKDGIAVRYTDPDGNITWRATPKFLISSGRGAGPLVTIGPFTSNSLSKECEMVVTTGEDIVEINRLPTGIAPLDLMLGGGIPQGRVTEIFGPPSSAKSILASKIVASKQIISPALRCIWIAVEPFDPLWAKQFGVDVHKLMIVNPHHAEHVAEISERLMEADDCGLVVLDSFAAMLTKNEIGNSKSDPTGLAMVGKLMFNKVKEAQRRAEKEGRTPTFIFTNQVRWKNGEMATPGGFLPKHAAAIRLRLSATDVFDKAVHSGLPARKEIRVVIEKADVPVTGQECALEIALLNQPGLAIGQVKNGKIHSTVFPA